jgi:hypothetical protein
MRKERVGGSRAAVNKTSETAGSVRVGHQFSQVFRNA